MENKTFRITKRQVNWLQYQSVKTGLQQVEIVRRALDAYAEAEEVKEQRRMFTPEQRREIRQVARTKGISEVEVVRHAIDKDLRRTHAAPLKN